MPGASFCCFYFRQCDFTFSIIALESENLSCMILAFKTVRELLHDLFSKYFTYATWPTVYQIQLKRMSIQQSFAVVFHKCVHHVACTDLINIFYIITEFLCVICKVIKEVCEHLPRIIAVVDVPTNLHPINFQNIFRYHVVKCIQY